MSAEDEFARRVALAPIRKMMREADERADWKTPVFLETELLGPPYHKDCYCFVDEGVVNVAIPCLTGFCRCRDLHGARLDTAAGQELDRIARVFGISRDALEELEKLLHENRSTRNE